MNKALDYFKKYPEIIESQIEMTGANSRINIYEGNYLLENGENKLEISGKIFFDWVPNLNVCFTGVTININNDVYKIIGDNSSIKIIIDSLEFGKGFFKNVSFGNFNEQSKINGILSQQAVLGDKSITVDKILFEVPNLREFHGSSIIKTTDNNISLSRGRIQLENDKYIITLDKKDNYEKLIDELNKNGGYILLYNGELISKKGSIGFEESKDVFHCLNTFLTFLNGRKTSSLFMSGLFEDELKWCDYSQYPVDTFKEVISWPQDHSIAGFHLIWNSFSKLWKDTDDRFFLTFVIHWYTEANNSSGYTEGSIIMAQTALELLYNWWIIENKKIITGKDSENISASNKIRLLLSQLNINYSVPAGYIHLQKFVDNEKHITDAPDAIVQIRNAIVHSQEEKRKKLSEIHSLTMYEALQLSIWYIEMALLKILKFDEKYFNRTSKEFIKSKGTEFVPWIKR